MRGSFSVVGGFEGMDGVLHDGIFLFGLILLLLRLGRRVGLH